MPDDPKYLYRIQHDDSFSEYMVDTGVVATHHNPKYRSNFKKNVGTSLGDTDLGNKKDSALDLLNHMHFYSKETSSCISTSSSLEFAIYWSHRQRYYHTGVHIFVIDVEEVKCHQQVRVFHARTVLDTLQSSHGQCATPDFEQSLEKSRRCAESFKEWIVTVHIPASAIIRTLPYKNVYEFKPNCYPPLRGPLCQDNFIGFKAWKAAALRNKINFPQCEQLEGQVIKFIRELAKDLATFAKHAFTELSEGMSRSFIDETLALVELSSINIGALPRTSEQDTRSLIANEDASSGSTSSSGSDDQEYPESVSDSAYDLGLEKTFEKLTLKGNRFLSTR